MPTYSYRGTACSHEFDYVQKFTDEPLTECIECQGPVRRVYQPVGVVFKGSGWYINDSRKTDAGSGAKEGDSPSNNGKKDGGDSAPSSTADVPAKSGSSKKDAPAKAAAD
jgi:putative FmdB family regulatory protein